jgi:hypothetical protein
MNKLEQFIEQLPYGFLRGPADTAELIKLDRFFQVLVRCGGFRFTCAVQDVDHLCKCVAAGGDHVRDVSIPVGGREWAAKWKEDCVITPFAQLPDSFLQRKGVTHARHPEYETQFNEADCGGVFDGFGVTSDADPGL